MPDETKYLFLDTMVFLHFRPVEEIRWTELLNCSRVEIILPRVTIRELDKHKTTHILTKVRDRARRSLKKIEDKLNSDDRALREDVFLRFLDSPQSIDYASIGLNPDWADDILLASILIFKQENLDYKVIFATDDTGARIKGRLLGIETFELPGELRLPSEPDPLVEENRKLRERIAKLTCAIPDLLIQFSNEKSYIKFTYSEIPVESGEERTARIAEELEKERQNHQWKPSLKVAPLFTPRKNEIERYNRDLNEYLEKYGQYLNDLADWQIYQARIFPFEIEMVNDGTTPADDILILLDFPGAFLLRKENDLKSKPSPPTKPILPRSTIELIQGVGRFSDYMHRSLFNIPDLTPISRELPNVSSPRIRCENGYEVEYHIHRIKHGFSIKLDPLFMDFSESQELTSFHVNYLINAANIPENIEGELHVILEAEI